MKKQKRTPFEHEIVLGKNIWRWRDHLKLGPRDIGKKLKMTEKQYLQLERGAFVPLPKLEIIGKVLGQPVQKRDIRRISFLRKLEKETGIEQVDLIGIYNEILPHPEFEE
ncbi:MAG: hypothetical protein HRU29_10815 [Rhizobiales bacterium]|nr:hypothetical protein [Hyphomicrobiales bacterium]NRB14884.1 hypothetical protein [Hyphomicrobiales bacterium]